MKIPVPFKDLPKGVFAKWSKITPPFFVVIIHRTINYYLRHTDTVYKQLQHMKDKLCRISSFTSTAKQQIWNKNTC